MFENLTKGFSTEGISASVSGITSNFYYMVAIIAILILILLLTYVGLLMVKKGYKDKEFPPVQNNCPDYWTVDSSNPNICKIPAAGIKNTGDIYINGTTNTLSSSGSGRSTTYGLNINDGTIDFSNASWATTGVSATCAKKRWANVHGILWDGVANYNKC
jgi:hypothetical protein